MYKNLNDAVKTALSPLALAAIALFFVLFQLHLPDSGGLFVARNLLAWTGISFSILLLWGRPLISGQASCPAFPAFCLGLPVLAAVGFIMLTLSQGLTPTPASFLMPFMLALFMLLLLGLLQNPLTDRQWLYVCFFVCLGSLPQVIFSLPDIGLHHKDFFARTVPPFLSKPSGGFGQPNLYTSFLASLIIWIGWAISCLSPISRWLYVFLFGCAGFFAFALALEPSKTGLAGLIPATLILFMLSLSLPHRGAGSHALTIDKKRLMQWFIVVLAGIGMAYGLSAVRNIDFMTNQQWNLTTGALQTRMIIWQVSFHAFLHAPFFGHGVGQFSDAYLATFIVLKETGRGAALLFLPNNVHDPHNLLLFILVEMGLVGVLLVLGPYILLAIVLLSARRANWLVVPLLTPILLHCLLEYPYKAAGTHYWLFAVLLAAGLHGHLWRSHATRGHLWRSHATRGHLWRGHLWRFRPALPLHYICSPLHLLLDKLRYGTGYAAQYAVFAGLGLFCGAVMMVTIATSQETARAVRRTYIMPTKSIYEVLMRRFHHSDLYHPLIGQRQQAITLIYLVDRATREGQVDMLGSLLLPMFDKHVRDDWQNRTNWRIRFDALMLLGDYQAAYNHISDIARFDQNLADEFYTQLQAVKQQANKTAYRRTDYRKDDN